MVCYWSRILKSNQHKLNKVMYEILYNLHCISKILKNIITTGISLLNMTILLIIVVVVCQQMRITMKLSFIITLRTDSRLRYHYVRYVNKGGGVYLDTDSAKFDDAPV